jgi:hypothetical protein
LERVIARAGVDAATFRSHFRDLEELRTDLRGAAQRIRRRGCRRLQFAGGVARSDARCPLGDARIPPRRPAPRLFHEQLDDPDSLTPYTAETIGSAIYQQFQATIARFDFQTLEGMIPQMMYTAVLPYLGSAVAAEELRIAPPRPPLAA